MKFLEEAALSEETARLVGVDSLPERERFVLRLAERFQEEFLRQNAYDEDAWCAPERQMEMLEHFMELRRGAPSVIPGAVQEPGQEDAP